MSQGFMVIIQADGQTYYNITSLARKTNLFCKIGFQLVFFFYDGHHLQVRGFPSSYLSLYHWVIGTDAAHPAVMRPGL